LELICPYCHFSKDMPDSEIISNTTLAICPRCNQRFDPNSMEKKSEVTESSPEFEFISDNPAASDEKEDKPSFSPWEERSELGLWRAIFQTIKDVMLSPDTFFNYTFMNGYKESLAFGLLIGSLGSMIGFFWQFLMFSGGISLAIQPLIGKLTISMIFLLLIAFVPIFIIFKILFTSLLIHTLLRLVRSGENGYEATFRVISYSQATQIIGLIPFIGFMVSFVWIFIIQIVGLRKVHQTSYLKIIIAFLIPVFILLFLGILAILIFIIMLT